MKTETPQRLGSQSDSAIAEHTGETVERRMIRSRLGIYSSLFFALRAKHPPTAAHSMRVALGCSKWAEVKNMPEPERELLEIGALLHDLGKLGVPDRILQKSDMLIANEQMLMQLHCELAVEILAAAGASSDLLEIVRTYRFDPHSVGIMPENSQIDSSCITRKPRAARMLAIADAFDSMTTEQVFRKALSREMAVAELFKYAGTQFDSALVKEFALLVSQPNSSLEASLGKRWLHQLAADPAHGFGDGSVMVSHGQTHTILDKLYHHRMLEAMSDAAIYVDYDGRVLVWNRAAEKLTGLSSASILHQPLTSQLIGLKDVLGNTVSDETCPLVQIFKAQVASTSRMQLCSTEDRAIAIALHALPVFSAQREFCGAIFMIRDASDQAQLEERVQSLHEIATTDTLTHVSNRAELNRFLPEFVANHLSSSEPGSLIICDIDYFKRINDTYGHQAGDDALISFARVLKQLAREGDMVARYGGEEFVLLCANCDNTAATNRAEEIRRSVEGTPIPSLRNNCLTASFGVTEIQRGDCAETLLARADRALLLAKDTGRNRVVQLGAGLQTQEEPEKKKSWFSWFAATESKASIIEKEFLTAVPRDIAVEKLSGFIHDHKAEVIKVENDRVIIQMHSKQVQTHRRSNDRPMELLIDVRFEQVEVRPAGQRGSIQCQTRLWVTIRAAKVRDRRLANILTQATQLLISFKSYLLAQELTEDMKTYIIEPR
jgi:diguanylate cyclase (GGDEF)-like protein